MAFKNLSSPVAPATIKQPVAKEPGDPNDLSTNEARVDTTPDSLPSIPWPPVATNPKPMKVK